jgi:hypothetical protein
VIHIDHAVPIQKERRFSLSQSRLHEQGLGEPEVLGHANVAEQSGNY